MPFIIPVFIPHQGCPHTCIFCNQHRISGRENTGPVTPAQVREIVRTWLSRSRERKGEEVQVAFYGGSFTGMERPRQEELLAAVAPFIDSGQVQAIRLSTRPDYVDSETAPLLRRYGVAVVELGVQSMDRVVLEASDRGHSPEQAVAALGLLRHGGLEVGVQLMVGLPCQTTRSLMRTVREVTRLRPDFVRIYPVLVLRGSRLAALYEQGKYVPLTIDGAVVRTARMKKIFAAQGIRVIRMGLQAGEELEKNIVAGPYHPAFGEMVSGRLMLQQARKLLAGAGENTRGRLTINDRDHSIFRGIRSKNIKRLAELDLLDRFTLEADPSLPRQSLQFTPGP